MATRSDEISQQIKTAAAEITSPQLSFAFANEAEKGFEENLKEADNKPAIEDVFNAAGNNKNEARLALQSESVSGTDGYGIKFSEHNKKAAEREKRRKSKTGDAMLMAMLEAGRIGEHIAGQVFDNKSDAEIAEIVADIEAETGKSFEDYAKEILGEDMSLRRPNESDVDYQRRILKDITKEMIDPATGEIKPEYADDPVAKYIKEDSAYKKIVQEVKNINETVKHEGKTVETDAAVEKLTQESFVSAEAFEINIDDQEYKEFAQAKLEGHWDASTIEDQNHIDRSSGFMSSFGASKTEIASKNGMDEFNNKASGDFEKDTGSENIADPPSAPSTTPDVIV